MSDQRYSPERVERLEKRAERERRRRREAERLGEEATRDLFEGQRLLEQAVVAVQEKTEHLSKRIRQQTALQEVGRRSLRHRDLDEVLIELCTRTNEVLATDYCDVFQLDCEAGELVLSAGVGWPEDAVGQLTLDVTEGSQSAHTVDHWEPTVVEDYEEDSRFERPAPFAEAGLRSGVSVVVPAPDHPWGVFGVHAPEPRAFDEHDVTFVQTMARILGNVIQRQRARDRLHEENRRFQSLIDEVEEYAIFRLDTEGNIRSWNTGAEDLYRYPADEIVGEPYARLYTPEDRRSGRPPETLRKALEEAGTEGEGWRVRGDGRRFWADVTITPYRDDDGELLGFWKVVKDLTDRRENRRWLEAANQRMRQLTHAASHDLKEPARTVTTFLQLLQRTCGDRFQAEDWQLFSYAEEGARRMRRTARNLGELADVMGRHHPTEPTDPETVLDRVLAGLKAEIETGDAEITVAELPTVEADPDQLAHLFHHLLENAFAFSGDEPPRVSIDGEPIERGWHFRVRDEGIGIDPAYAQRVFEPFRHLGRSRPGEGIGLTICKLIVDRHGGDIWIESEAGEGTTVHFTLAEAPRDIPHGNAGL